MHLLRVRVPDFRVLKDVDISFEKEFIPRVFPLGSQNGGGKSTLLQLIFVLLHCSTEPERSTFLRNFLMGFDLAEGQDKRTLAIIDIWDGEKCLSLEFFSITQQDNLLETLKSEDDPYRYTMPIVNFSSNKYQHEDLVLVCSLKNSEDKRVWNFLDGLSKKVFLAVPFSQVLLLLPLQIRKTLFMSNSNSSINNTYHYNLREANLLLNGLFTYSFLAVDILVDSFKTARDKDFIRAIETNGAYGNNYKTLLGDLNILMGDKIVNLSSNFSEITFKLDKPDRNVELYPEDLSHGELKRLSIYMWLKHLDIKDAIVLMDEVDIALHPDWQFRIVGDLTEWAPSNQYILATHSHELCQALTPSHVKVLEPKLTERRSTQL